VTNGPAVDVVLAAALGGNTGNVEWGDVGSVPVGGGGGSGGASGPTFTSAPATGTTAEGAYIAGAGPQVQDPDGVLRYAFVEPNSGDIAAATTSTAAELADINAKTPGLTPGGSVPVELQGTPLVDTGLEASGGLAVEAKQDAGNALLESLDAKAPDLTAAGNVPVELRGTATVNVASAALPAGAATEETLGTRASEATLSALNQKIPASPAQDRTAATAPSAVRLSSGSAFYDAAKAGDNMGADLRVGGAAVTNANAVPVSDAGGSITVDAVALPLPTGASTSAAQATGNASLASIDAGVPDGLGAAGGMRIEGVSGGLAVAVSAAALPLPNGAATAAAQTTGNTSLSNIDAGIPAALGQAVAAASMPVVLPATQSPGTLAQDASLDQVEGYLDGVETELAGIRAQGALGTAYAQTTANVTSTAGQLPSFSAPRGFTIQNPSSNLRSVFVGPNSAVTTANGYEIQPGTSEDFLLGNANFVFAIAAAGTNPIIIAEIH
jgi:hypothetical protein